MSRDAGHDAARGGPITGWAAVTEPEDRSS